MITEDYVSFKTAKLLREKGFDEKCRAVYEEKILRINTLCDYLNSELSSYVCAPTLQMACKWLREVHNLSVETFSIKGTSNVCPVFWKGNIVELLTQERAFSGELVYSYEEAVEAALKYTLENLI